MPIPPIFVSHASQDREWCRCFVTTLRQAGLDVWYDEHDIQGGADWYNTIQQQLLARDCFLLILSPDAWNSKWVQRELELAHIKNKRILPVLHRPTQVTGFLEAIQFIKVVDRDCVSAAQIVFDVLTQRPAPPPAEPLPPRLQQMGFRELSAGDVRYALPPMVAIPAGTFIMGSDPRLDTAAENDEVPQHQAITGAYYLGMFPVTVAEYQYAVRVGAVLEPPRTEQNPLTWQQQTQRRDHPVVGVDWLNARDYAGWLAELTGQPWRLPGEAEWEKAARGTDGRIFPWGNVWEMARTNTSEARVQTTTAVGAYDNGSPYGVYDMAGNVWQWTRSQPRPYPYLAQDGREDMTDSRQMRVMRGGSYANSVRLARAAFRMLSPPDTVLGDLGFRLCLG